MLPEVVADVVGAVVGAEHDRVLAGVGRAGAELAGVHDVAGEGFGAGDVRDVRRARHTCGENDVGWAECEGLAVTDEIDTPRVGVCVEFGVGALGGRPVVELHDLDVHLKPVAHLVLRGVDGPVVREWDVGHVVEPDGVMEREGVVAVAPRVAGVLVAFDDDGGDVETTEARGEADSTLAAADDEDVGLAGVAECVLLSLAALEPGGAVFVCAVVDAHVTGEALLFFVAGEFPEGGEELPGFAVSEAEAAFAASNVGGEGEPCVGDAVRGGGVAFELPVGRSRPGVAGLEHLEDLIAAFKGFDVPGEGDEVTPVGFFMEVVGGGLGVVTGEGAGEHFEPFGGLAGGNAAGGGLAGGNGVSPRGRRDAWMVGRYAILREGEPERGE